MAASNGITVVIPNRAEIWLRQTIQALNRARAGCPMQVLVINDGAPGQEVTDLSEPEFTVQAMNHSPWHGLGFSRDRGIEAARYSTIFVCDAHMDFEDGIFDSMQEWSTGNPQAIGCGVCWGLDVNGWQPAVPKVLGKNFAEQDTARDGFDWGDENKGYTDSRYGWGNIPRFGVKLKLLETRSNRQHTIFERRWIDASNDPRRQELHRLIMKQRKPAPVACVMGANYVFQRSWYMEGLQRPWRELWGWGCSEQNICLPNWFMGGENVLLPFHSAHWFKAQGEGWRQPAEWSTHNQYRLVYVLPLPASVRAELLAWLNADEYSWVGGMRRQVQQRVASLLGGSDYLEYADYLKENQVRSWDEWLDTWQPPEE